MILGLPYIDLEDAVIKGALRQLQGVVRGRTHSYPNGRPWEHNIEATIGEQAVARWRDHYYMGLHNDPRGVVDVGTVGEVRNTKVRGKPMLRVHEGDNPEHFFMLVNVQLGPYNGIEHFYEVEHPCVEVLGWLPGTEARVQRFARQYGNRLCWEVPPEALRKPPRA